MLNLRIPRLRYLSIFLLLLLGMVNAFAINLEVGDTYTCTLSSPPSSLKGCQWTISDTRAMEFVSTPGSYSTSVTVRAIAPQSTSTPFGALYLLLYGTRSDYGEVYIPKDRISGLEFLYQGQRTATH